MPELPEAHTISTDLNNHIVGYKITGIKIASKYKVKPDNKVFAEQLSNKKISGVSRIGKNIVIELDSGFLVFHLAMTGKLLIKSPKEKKGKWVRLVLKLENDEKEGNIQFLVFEDMRMFGKVSLLTSVELAKLKEKYGPEPLKEHLDAQKFLELIKSRNTNIKNLLLDQKTIAGMGNIYATDALFIAGIHPETRTDEMTLETAGKLLNAAREILQEGIQNRGSTLPDRMYLDIFGEEGNQQHFFRIYMKENCPNCKGKVEFKKISGRGTYFCPSCQTFGKQKSLL
jgi:formamidopyrimidine-DNA glycosylase